MDGLQVLKTWQLRQRQTHRRRPGAAMPAAERAAWMQATILQAVSTTLGRTVRLEEPLMTAGLDSLGRSTTSAGAEDFACMLLSKLGI